MPAPWRARLLQVVEADFTAAARELVGLVQGLGERGFGPGYVMEAFRWGWGLANRWCRAWGSGALARAT
jgi:hypothetical protein